jgi:hypothetical protein
MCLKQAIKRCGRRLSSAALMDLPVGLDGYEAAGDAAPPPPTAAEAIARVVNEAEGKAAVEAEYEVVQAEPEPPRVRLFAALTRIYGKLSKDVAAEKVALLYNEMMKEQTGVDPKMKFTKSAGIGPIEAEQLVAYLDARTGNATRSPALTGASGLTGPSGPAEANAAPPDEDEAPEAEQEAPDRTTEGAQKESSWNAAYDALMGTVLRARKLFGRKFVQESPPGSGKYWFTDQQTFAQAGHEASVKLQVGPNVVAPMELLEQLNRILAEACDTKERGGR